MPSTVAQAEAIAIAQAKMHVALEDFKLERAFVHDHAYWYNVAQEIKPSLNAADKVLLGKLLGLYEALTAVYRIVHVALSIRICFVTIPCLRVSS